MYEWNLQKKRRLVITMAMLLIAGTFWFYTLLLGIGSTQTQQHREWTLTTSNMTSHKTNSTVPPHEKPLRVIIVTQMRSGSSFTGELFNRNDDFFYLFEPLSDLAPKFFENRTTEHAYTYIERPLSDFVQCNFRDPWWSINGFNSKRQCTFSTQIQTSPLCHFNKAMGYLPLFEKMNHNHILENLCNNKQYAAMKVVRLEHINYLENILKNVSMNVKIIHLVRDPRGAFNSRNEMCHRVPFVKYCLNMSYTCERLEQNTNIWLDTPMWLQNKYILIRYEDLAMEPLLYAEKIYKFLNLQLPNSVRDWITENTKSDRDLRWWWHTRNSRRVATRWRNELKLSTVLEIQSQCKLVMERLGYKTVETEEMLRNSNYSVLEPLKTFTA
ncbi:carbohydrate sulfotransferase 1-like [Amphiura filiformis]|uniref:carbohydrate sulfotransferase 1-like n=1 Tax=Amphiura filiformis TaxID=82378 RepID=UPI003B21CCC5